MGNSMEEMQRDFDEIKKKIDSLDELWTLLKELVKQKSPEVMELKNEVSASWEFLDTMNQHLWIHIQPTMKTGYLKNSRRSNCSISKRTIQLGSLLRPKNSSKFKIPNQNYKYH